MVSKVTGTTAFGAPIPPAHSTFASPSPLVHWPLGPPYHPETSFWPPISHEHTSFSTSVATTTPAFAPPITLRLLFCPTIHQDNGLWAPVATLTPAFAPSTATKTPVMKHPYHPKTDFWAPTQTVTPAVDVGAPTLPSTSTQAPCKRHLASGTLLVGTVQAAT